MAEHKEYWETGDEQGKCARTDNGGLHGTENGTERTVDTGKHRTEILNGEVGCEPEKCCSDDDCGKCSIGEL